MVSNADFFRVLLGAATRPLNVLVLAFMLAAAIVVSPWIALAAVPVYGLLVWTSARDDAGPASTGPRLRSFDLQQLSPALQPRVAAARREQQAVLDELSRLEVAPEGVRDEVQALGADVIASARRGTELDRYLGSVDEHRLRERLRDYRVLGPGGEHASSAAAAIEEQLSVIDSLTQRRQALDDEIDNVEAGLGALRARIVQARAAATMPSGVATDIEGLRSRMRVLATSLDEAYRLQPSSEIPER